MEVLRNKYVAKALIIGTSFGFAAEKAGGAVESAAQQTASPVHIQECGAKAVALFRGADMNYITQKKVKHYNIRKEAMPEECDDTDIHTQLSVQVQRRFGSEGKFKPDSKWKVVSTTDLAIDDRSIVQGLFNAYSCGNQERTVYRSRGFTVDEAGDRQIVATSYNRSDPKSVAC